MAILQRLKSILIPEIGLDLTPEFVEEAEISTEISRSISHIVGRTGNRSIMIKATSDGRLLVAAAGSAMEIYTVETGTAPDTYDAGSTYDSANAIYVTDILVELNDLTISFRNHEGNYGDDKALLIGFTSIDLINYGIRIENRVGGVVGDYELTLYR